MRMLSLCYHAVSKRWSAPLSVTPEALESQLSLIRARGYRSATFTDAVHSGDRKTVCITFDDAFRSVHELAFPILHKLGFTGTVFVPTGFAGSEEPLAWPGIDNWRNGPFEDELMPMSLEEMRRLLDAGWELGSHTVTHPRLTALPDAMLAQELGDSKRDCEALFGVECTSLAYPYGDHDARVIAATERAGYRAAGTLPGPLHPATALRWPRVGIYHSDDTLRFRVKVSPVVAAIRGAAPVRRLEAAVR